MQLSLNKKIIGTVGLVVAMMILLGAISYWATNELVGVADEATSRLSDAREAEKAAFWAVKQYQNQADLIINQNLDLVKDFEESAEHFEASKKRIHEIVDTEQEKAWAKELDEADKQYDKIFSEGIVPAVEYQLEGVLKKLDAESDELISQAEEYAEKIAVSMWEELDEAAKNSNDQELAKRARDLDSVNRMLFWLIKQYQNQADLIINQDLNIIDDFKESVKQMDKYRDMVGQAVDTPEEKELFRKITEIDEKYDSLFFNKIVPAVEIELRKDIQRLDGESDELLAKVEENVESLVNSLAEEANEAVESYTGTAQSVKLLILAIAITATILGLVLGFLLARSITKPINRIIEGMTEGADQVSAASGQISQASQQLAEGANEQASGLEESSSSLEEMSSMTKQNADNARQANTLASGARDSAEKGTDAMKKMSTAIEDIKKSSDETAKIIKTIDEIAFQTNLLALNAAVEAARAGEAGKGFAVVAEEVRNLAQRSAEAAKNTSSLIEESKQNSDNGVKVSQEVGTILEEIVGSVRKVTDLVGEVAAASEEQSKGIDQVNSAVAQMDKVTQQNASNAEESASGSEELNAQAAQLKDMVGDLVALVGGTTTQGNGAGRATAAAKPQAERRQLHVAETATGLKKRVQGIIHKGDGGAGEQMPVPQAHADARVVKPEEVIPLDDKDKEFVDF